MIDNIDNLNPAEIRFIIRLLPLVNSNDNIIYYTKWNKDTVPVDKKEINRLFGFTQRTSGEIVDKLINLKLLKLNKSGYIEANLQRLKIYAQ